MTDYTYCPHCRTLLVPVLGRGVKFALDIHLRMTPPCNRRASQ